MSAWGEVRVSCTMYNGGNLGSLVPCTGWELRVSVRPAGRAACGGAARMEVGQEAVCRACEGRHTCCGAAV